ncbi:sugar phosphate nucleotidyltransferase [Pontiella sulfatireligans]|uniref:UTP--glucose-1-phosphate uridylyltransferase n=1 Tax=Pontiella sulfatireligans TaxID=2750658 RepID=A0A6C2UF42_9BACT|nr:sugar phosphate nucleotidyltransferase [Pontiella sulfatireligans]VGO18041.1 UTP--glucose-1-phosphate uridylyltransferase [Pontiella sulfatireligans]
MKIFVPGRICLFGEHSDWAGGYRRINADIEKGAALIVGTNQGLYAEVKPHPDKLILNASFEDGRRKGPFQIPMEREALLKEAMKGGFASYAAGVAYQILTHYRVRGLEIDNYHTDLPVQKGLSSSAAICVLVARAFNRIYDLKMTVRGEMEYAYLGEITTPSRCGRLDQGCAYGNRPVKMIFDGDRLDVEELTVPQTLHYVIVDLKAFKDTKEILAKLNQSYPFAEDGIQKKVQEYLGPINAEINRRASEAIRQGDVEELGKLMNEAQAKFDAHLQPACPSQLTSPVLHKLLAYEPLRPYVLGGKGVGSQGDGTAQFLVKDEDAQNKAMEIIERDLKMPCMKLDIESVNRLRKAVIPAAGFGNQLFPSTKTLKKEMFPIVDRDGRTKPVIMVIIEQVLNAGIEDVGIVIQEADRPLFEDFFHQHLAVEHVNKLSKEDQRYMQHIMDIGSHVTLLVQESQEGFGHAVHCAKEWVGSEAFILMLGDHLFASDTDTSCIQQLMNIYERTGRSVVGLQETPVDKVKHFGCVTGAWEGGGNLLSVTEFSEKPSIEYARAHLATQNVKDDHFLTIFGQYILTPRIFELLGENIERNMRERGEFQLTSCLDRLRQEEGVQGCRVHGRRFDIGLPEAYRQTVIDYPNT